MSNQAKRMLCTVNLEVAMAYFSELLLVFAWRKFPKHFNHAFRRIGDCEWWNGIPIRPSFLFVGLSCEARGPAMGRVPVEGVLESYLPKCTNGFIASKDTFESHKAWGSNQWNQQQFPSNPCKIHIRSTNFSLIKWLKNVSHS